MKNEGVPFWLGALLIAVVVIVAPVPPWMIDRFYAGEYYPTMQSIITSMSNAVPLALMDLYMLALVVLLLIWIVRFFGTLRQHGVIDAVWDIIRRVIRTASIIAILFMLMWGLNYRRTALEDRLGLSGPGPSADDLQAVISDANMLAVRMRPARAANGEPEMRDIVRKLPKPFNVALQRLGFPPLDVPGDPKYSLVLTPYFTAAGIDGMVNPLALESIVHPDLLPFERPFIVAHEWAHLAGAADEAEASAIGWLACMQGEPIYAYSASLYLIQEAGSVLPPARWQQSLAKLDPAVRGDLDLIAQRAARRNPRVQKTAFRVYDTYLKANRVDDGVASYDRALTLILSPKFRDAFVQIRAAK